MNNRAAYAYQTGDTAIFTQAGPLTWHATGATLGLSLQTGKTPLWLCLDGLGASPPARTLRALQTLLRRRLAWARGLGFVLADAAVLALMATAAAWRQAQRGHALRVPPGWALQAGTLPRLSAWPDAAGAAALHGLSLPPAARTLGLYPVVDTADWVQRLIGLGVRCVQLRLKGGSPAQWRAHITAAVAAARASGAQLYINDHWALALEAGAWGVHLGQSDLDALSPTDLAQIAQSGTHLGLSTHSLWELARAHALAPSYVACGPVYPTSSKPMPWRSQGLHNLAWWAARASQPVVAIGGLNAQRLSGVRRCGAAGAALISAITATPDPDLATRTLLHTWDQAAAARPLRAPALPRPSLD